VKQMGCWIEPFVQLRAQKIIRLRRDPMERADVASNTYWDWVLTHSYTMYERQVSRCTKN